MYVGVCLLCAGECWCVHGYVGDVGVCMDV